MTVSKKRAVIYDGGLGGTGQSFCSFMRLKCTEKVQYRVCMNGVRAQETSRN